MSYTKISAQVEDQSVMLTNVPKLASGGNNEVQICIEFDTLWNGFKKTAVFYKKFGAVYHVALDSSGCVVVPSEVMKNKGIFYFGVFGEEGERVRTTEVIAFDVVQGAAIAHETEYEPTPDIYAEILEVANNALRIAQSVRDDADAGLFGSGGTDSGNSGGSTVMIPETLPNPYALVINGVSYDGSEKVEINIKPGADIEIDLSDYYTKMEIDSMVGAYITDIDNLVGGGA